MKPYFIVFLLLMLGRMAVGQTLTGKIVDENQHAIQGAHILHGKTDGHAHSDENGQFSLEHCTLGDSLLVSFVGYETKQLRITDLKQTVVIVLSKSTIKLDEIVVSPTIDALHIITDIDLKTRPVSSSQDVLQKVPGLFIGQHAGGGKAEQMFLRGFDIDHGTDINISVDGLPVNMVSHAHGQGYADLHFVIPETVDKIAFGKGPYYEDKGNFTTAGYVDFSTKDKLENSTIKLEAGQFNTQRVLGMFNLLAGSKHNAYVATEFLSTDGYFDSPQNFNRLNILGKYTSKINDRDKLGITASFFDSKWDASGQIPQRAVDSGLISRFGAIDDTEGGATSRSNLVVNYDKYLNDNSIIKSKVYLSHYDFELYSNFTFWLDDPTNGDQIRQKESRSIYGLQSEYRQAFSNTRLNGSWHAGISLRNDQSKGNELAHSQNRQETLKQISFGDINETNLGVFVGTTIHLNRWTFNPSLRVDYFDFQYNDGLVTAYKTQNETKAIASPKLNVLYSPTDYVQLYAKAGKGFHSNDTRVVVAEKGSEILPAAYGFDLGYIWKPNPKMLVNMAYWYLYLEQEFVYVGDAGIVEPSGKTNRQGVDFSFRYQPLGWLFWNVDVNYTHGRAIGEPNGEDYIPLAPAFTLVSGLNLMFKSGIYGGLHVRHLANRPANEDNSLVAKGYTVTDFNAGYNWQNMSLGVQIQNLFDVAWNETQFATESRLQAETEPVEEIHFTPGTPFFIKATVQYKF